VKVVSLTLACKAASPTVVLMTATTLSIHTLPNLHLGDLVSIHTGKVYTLRMFCFIPENELNIQALALLGEMEAVVAFSENKAEILLPVQQWPAQLKASKVLTEGASNYWSPHLPALQRAMGEVLYQLLLLRSSWSPAVKITRSKEDILFVKTGECEISTLKTLHMPRSSTAGNVDRYAGVVSPVHEPTREPTPEWAQPLPKEPARTR